MSPPHVLTIWWTSAHQQLRSAGQFGVPQQISTGFVSPHRYCTNVAPRKSTKLCTMFVCHLGWYTIFFLPPNRTATCKIHFASKVLCSPILAALMHCTRAVGISQTFWHDTKMKLRNFRFSLFSTEGATCIPRVARTLGINPHSSFT